VVLTLHSHEGIQHIHAHGNAGKRRGAYTSAALDSFKHNNTLLQRVQCEVLASAHINARMELHTTLAFIKAASAFQDDYPYLLHTNSA
jgi:hypothetical protein